MIVAYLSLLGGLGILVPALLLLGSSKDAPSRDHVKWALIVHLTLTALAVVVYVELIPGHNELALEAIVFAAAISLNVWAMLKSLRQMKLATVSAAV